MPGALPLLITAGLGLPELLHAEVGVFPTDHLSIEARYGNVILNHEVGLGASWWFRNTPLHVVATGEAMINPVFDTFTLGSGGDRLAAYVGTYGGVAYRGDRGFLARADLGLLFYDDGGFAVGPNGRAGVGWVF